jgi:polysaccharide export outer membrane protein
MVSRILFLTLLSALFFSCASKQKVVYFGGMKDIKNDVASPNSYEPIIQHDDMLLILVSAIEREAAIPYNLTTFAVGDNTANVGGMLQHQTYLVDKNGNIEFPVLGTIKVAGLTRSETVAKIKLMLEKYIKGPVINLRIMNFKFSVLGEVTRPGVYTTQTERTTLLEAIALAGDLSIFGNRQNILVIRESNGVKTHNYIDITNSKFIDSPFYYLDQNDIVYVEPNRARINSSVVGPNLSLIISAVSVLITVVALLIR